MLYQMNNGFEHQMDITYKNINIKQEKTNYLGCKVDEKKKRKAINISR